MKQNYALYKNNETKLCTILDIYNRQTVFLIFILYHHYMMLVNKCIIDACDFSTAI